jgi:outer membrane receptor for ferrienterochelin and colicin
MRKFYAAALAALFSCLSIPAFAATDGQVRGTVTLDGAPTAGVALSLAGEGSTFTTKSDATGGYVFSQIPFGHYRLTSHLDGTSDRAFDLDVASDSVVSLDIPLSKLKTIVVTSVNGRAGASGTPVSGNVLGRQTLATLPTNTSLDRVVQTVPGIVRFSYDEPVAHGFHGLTYEIDGAPIPQATSSNFSEIIDPKNVDSIEILTGAFPAEYGGSREGAVVNILTNRANSLKVPYSGSFTAGFGNQGQSVASLDQAFKAGPLDVYFSANGQHTQRGLDAPTFTAQHDDSSQADQFLRMVSPFGKNATLAFDYSNQFAQFQIPINTDPNDRYDPQVSVPGTADVQREYDRYANFNYTKVSNDGNGVFQLIPWYRSTRIAFDGDLANDVLATQPDPVTGLPVNLIGLRQDRQATYAGLRASVYRASDRHAWKVGVDLSRENLTAAETFACYDSNCDGSGAHLQPFYATSTNAAQAGSQIGIYAQDKWSPSRVVSVDYGVRYDHSTGYTGGDQISPRIGINVAPNAKDVVHFYYGRMYAAPALEDVRQACVVLAGCSTTPTYDLKPERDTYYEMGVSHTFSRGLTGYVNYFNRLATNVLDTTQLLNTPLFAVFNNARGRDEGVEVRLQGTSLSTGDSWFLSGTASNAQASGVSGSTFLFPPDAVSDTSWQPEDHDQTYELNGAYTHRFGADRAWFATLQSEYGSGFPVAFESGEGRLPTHLTFDLALGKQAGTGANKSLGFDLNVENLLNHQYVIKIANGFNTTQISNGRKILFRVTAPL